jgi:hypothetical protein
MDIIDRAPALAVLGLLLGLGACGFGNSITVHDRGQVGVTVDGAGRPVLAVMTCRPVTPVITLSEGRGPSDPDDRPNVDRGRWQARGPFAGVRLLPLTAPTDLWRRTGAEPGPLEAGRLFVAGGGTTDDQDADLTQVSFTGADLAALAPGQVRTGEGTVRSMADFGAHRCAGD